MGYVREIEGVRGLMALWVVFGHWSTTVAVTHPIFQTKLWNGFAVDVFVIISGFAIAAMLQNRDDGYGKFLARRFLRIFPIYWFYLLLSVLIAPAAIGLWQSSPEGYMKATRIDIATATMDNWSAHLAAHLVALQAMVPKVLLPRSEYAFIGQAWSISLEWQFYLLAPLFVLMLRQLFNLKIPILLIAGFAGIVLLSFIMPSGFLGRYLHVFALGIASFWLVSAHHEGKVSSNHVALGLLGVAVILSVLLALGRVNMVPYLIWVAVLAMVILKDQNVISGVTSRLLNSAPLQRLGNLSYSIYLSHMLVILGGVYLINALGLTTPLAQGTFLLAFTLVGTWILSVASYKFLERPMHQIGRKL